MRKKKGKGGEYVDLYPGSDYDPTQWERACVTVDTCICRIAEGELQVLLSKREYGPFKGAWGFPGGFVDIVAGESLQQASYRTLKEKTGILDIPVRQLGTYGGSGRDPRWRMITVVYYALVCDDIVDHQVFKRLKENENELEHRWTPVMNPGSMAFDHGAILEDLLKRLQLEIRQSPIAFELVPPEFTWAQLQRVYESVLGHELTAGNFRRDLLRIYKVRKLNRLEPGKGRGKGRTGSLLEYIGYKSSL
ncbi:MAG: NUDIX hydrolase [bacterium]|nr:NUDIX hydrolase [bacterium]